MNLFYKGLFYLKAKDLTKDVLIYLLPETKVNEKDIGSLNKKLERIQSLYDKVNWDSEPILEKILLLIYKAKKNYLDQNYKDSKKVAFEIRKTIVSSTTNLTEIGKNLLLFSAELIEIKTLIDEWALSADEEYNSFYKEFFVLTETILKNREVIIGINDKLSPEFITLNKDYILSIIKLNEMSDKKLKGLVISEEKKEEGKILLNKLSYFEEKIKKYKNDTLNFNYNILLEKIKIGVYLNSEIEKNFKLMSDFCYLCVNNAIEDPVYSALESFRKNQKKNNSFKDYLYSFKLEIFKSEDKKILFKLQKIENFIAKEEERIQIKKVKKLEDTNAKV